MFWETCMTCAKRTKGSSSRSRAGCIDVRTSSRSWKFRRLSGSCFGHLINKCKKWEPRPKIPGGRTLEKRAKRRSSYFWERDVILAPSPGKGMTVRPSSRNLFRVVLCSSLVRLRVWQLSANGNPYESHDTVATNYVTWILNTEGTLVRLLVAPQLFRLHRQRFVQFKMHILLGESS